MKTLPAETGAAAPDLLVFLDETGAPERWLALAPDGVVGRGDASAGWPEATGRTLLAVPGEQVTIRWVELADGLTQAQAAAAARLMLADASAEPIDRLHVAVGQGEAGRFPVALVPRDRMAGWIAAAETQGLDPAAIVPTTLLLAPPETGFVRRDRGPLGDYRAPGDAFSLEPELAAPLVGAASVEAIDEERFEAGLAPLVAKPPIDLRQGPFAGRRPWKIAPGRLRRLAVLAAALVLLTLAVQLALILSYTFAADQARAEAQALAARGAAGPGQARPGFSAGAGALFAAIRDTPNAELARIEYGADGSLTATVMMDSAATLEAVRERIEASGLRVETGAPRNAGGRPTADMVLRPA